MRDSADSANVATRSRPGHRFPHCRAQWDATPTLYSVVRFAEALGVDPGELVKGLRTGLPKRRRR